MSKSSWLVADFALKADAVGNISWSFIFAKTAHKKGTFSLG